MFNACNILRDRVVLTLTAVMLLSAAADAQPLPAMPRGPLARLVKTPDASAGLPPFALADQSGAIQRYVEPVAGIDLEPYVDQVVSVRHDTGQTLLASQLELPSQRLYPMVGEVGATGSSGTAGRIASLATDELHSNSRVQQAQYVDSDDATVELLGEDEALPNGNGPMYQGAAPDGAIYPDGYPVFPGQMPPGAQSMNGDPVYYDPTYGGPQPSGPFPAEYGMKPEYGGYYDPGHPQEMGYVQPFDKPQRERAHIYADVEINFLRLHMMEEQIGKLSEKYDFSPRFIFGFTGVGNLDGRVRYWLYGRETQALNDESVRLEFDVLDLEATHYFAGRRSQLVLGAGLRLARIELGDDDDDEDAGCDLIGITFGADGLTPLIKSDGGRVGWVYGGRLSILGGDWGGDDDNDFVDGRMRDDNVVAHELYAGIEFARCYRSLDLHARLAFEMQNWHSDVLSESTEVDSIGFVGPGVRIGAEF